MAVFVILADDDPQAEIIHDRIKAAFPTYLRYSTRSWLVSARGKTARQVSEDIGVSAGDPSVTGIAVLQLAGPYWGRANPNAWTWLKSQFEQSDG